jgi:hypothetical protein
MDAIAQRYLLLGLRLERHVPGFVDSYIGPAELREAVAGEPPTPLAELRDEAAVLAELTEAPSAGDDAQRRRGAWLRAQLRAIRALARAADGEESGYPDLVEELYDVRIGRVPEERFTAARAALDAVLPGRGTLAERFQAASDRLTIPPERVLEVLRASTERFRKAARRDFEVPDDEEILWGETRDQPWGAEARFQGNDRTLVRINLDLPVTVRTVPYLASHEGYPGHHLENVSKERALVRGAGLGEATLKTMNTPESLLAEGLADVAREVVMSDLELAGEMRRVARDGGIVDVAEAALLAPEIGRALTEMQAAVGNAAIMLHEQGLPAAQVRDYLVETTIQPAVMVDHLMRTLADPIGRTYPFTYTEGARLIRAWLEVQGQTTGFARLLAEQHTPSGLAVEAAV